MLVWAKLESSFDKFIWKYNIGFSIQIILFVISDNTVMYTLKMSNSSYLPRAFDFVCMDHCYSKPWSAHPDASNARPLRLLFMQKPQRPKDVEHSRLVNGAVIHLL